MPPERHKHLKVDNRVTKQNRIVHGDYFKETANDELSKTHLPTQQLTMTSLSEYVNELGFTSIYDVALSAARLAAQSNRHTRQRKELRSFGAAGGISELFALSESIFHANGTSNEQPLHHTRLVTEKGVKIVGNELSILRTCQALRMPPSGFTQDFIQSFSFDDIYETMRQHAPSLVSFVESQQSQERTATYRHRQVVLSISILLSGSPANIVHNFMAYYLYASGVPKRVIGAGNHLYFSSSYDVVREGLKQMAEANRKEISKSSSVGRAFMTIFDNINWMHDVRYQVLHNSPHFSSGVVGYLLFLHDPPPLLTHADVNSAAAQELKVWDFFPSIKDENIMLASFRYSLFSVIKSYAKQMDLGDLGFEVPQPKVHPLDPTKKAKIRPLRLYDLDEAKMNEMIQILRNILDDIGLSGKQRRENILLFGGDLLTVRNIRSASFNVILINGD
jgi:hypothetical protein